MMKRGKGRNGLLPSSLRIISSCLKTVSSNAGSVASTVRSAGASVAASIALPAENEKDQVLWAGFDKLELGPSSFKHVLLIGYSNGFQVVDVEDASNVCESVSKRDGPVTFLQMQPFPVTAGGIDATEGFRASHPMLLVVASDETNGVGVVQGGRLSALIRETSSESQTGNCISTPTVVRFYSLKSNSYVHVLRFRSAVYIVRCSPQIVAIALAAQIYCFDAVTLENKFSVLTYPLQGASGVNIGYGPMAVGPRWLAYASNSPLLSSSGRLCPQNLTPSPGVSPSTSPGSGILVARYAMESSKQLAAGILNLGDMGYKTLSKYCQELLPDGSTSPLSPSSSKRVGKLPSTVHPIEADNAGMVVIKDFVSKEVISQFRAHTSPISALCFDPSGTLLVTASVHGHNINVFRIMPTIASNGNGSSLYESTSSHVHLYKLYRGLTSAVIQDICFSHYSQWIAIVSARGTCHIFTLSPFGGDASLQPQKPHSDGTSLTPNVSKPWWSNSSFIMDQQFHPPPLPVTISVVSRIKNSNSGWLNTVSNVAASARGQISIPSGAIAAVYHNSVHHDSVPVLSKAKSLEHLLVFSPSGHVVQHELVPSSGLESSDYSPRVGSSPLLQLQDEELRVNAEPVQWWDVCRRSNWPERDEIISQNFFNNQQNILLVIDNSDCEENANTGSTSTSLTSGKDCMRIREKKHCWYLSNAEVQINSGRIPVWQISKICFYVMNLSIDAGRAISYVGGETEIEKLPCQEVVLRRRELLPVFEQFRYSQQDSDDRGLAGGGFQNVPSQRNPARDTRKDGAWQAKPMPSSGSDTDSLDTEDARKFNCRSVDKPIPHEPAESAPSVAHSVVSNGSIGPLKALFGADASSMILQNQSNNTQSDSHSLMDGLVINAQHYKASSLSYGPVITDMHSSNNGVSTEIHPGQTESSDSRNSLEFPQYFHEGYRKMSELDDGRELTEAVTDADSGSSHCKREKPEEGGDNDDMLVGVFAFSEG